MSARPSTSRRISGRPALAVAFAGAAAGAALAERRHLRAIAADPDFRTLSEPLGGRPVDGVVSPDGTRLHVERFDGSEGEATLVLAHGWTEQLSLWGPVIRHLDASDLSIVAYDLRGHGASDAAADGDYTLARFGEDLEAVLAAAGADPSRTAVAGHSLGAMSIAAWAAAHDVTTRVAAAALINTGFDGLIGGALVFGELGAKLSPEWLGKGLLGSARPMLPVSTAVSERVARHVAFGPEASRGTVAFYERMLLDTDAGARGATGIALSTLDLSAAVSRITVPTLVVAGDRDRLTPPAHARRIAAALPRPTRLLELPRTGHMSPLERPDELAGALRGLLAEAGVAPEPAAAG
jgi:pimeloyl-ACP methyl ester carboxylesterase